MRNVFKKQHPAEVLKNHISDDLQSAKTALLDAHKQLEFHLAIVPMLEKRIKRLEAMTHEDV